MPVQTINLDRVEKQLAELLAIVERNGDVVIAQNGKPVARLATLACPQKEETDCRLKSWHDLDERRFQRTVAR